MAKNPVTTVTTVTTKNKILIYKGLVVTMRCNRNDVVTADIIDEMWLINKLEDAGRTLIALKDSGYSPKLAQCQHDVVHSVWDTYSWEAPRMKIPSPSREAIADMEATYGWVSIIPASEPALRRIVHARSLRHPVTDRYLVSWRRLADILRTRHPEVQRLHTKAIKIILKGVPIHPRIR